MKNYDCYFIDFDGTIFDTRESLIPVYRYAFAQVGITDISIEECEKFMHLNLKQTAELRNLPQEDYQKFYDATDYALDMDETISLIKPFPETMEFLEKMKGLGKRLCIVSGNIEHHIFIILKKHHASTYFENMVGAESYRHGKPNPEPVLIGCHKMGFEPSANLVYVGDSLQDQECGRAAGIDTILIDRNDAHPDFEGKRIHSLLELIA